MRRHVISFSLVALACGSGTSAPPQNQQPDGRIGAAGGTVRSADGRATVVIPPGALAQPVAIALSRVTGPVLAMLSSSVYELSPAGTNFQQPARLTVAYDAATLPAGLGNGAGITMVEVRGTELRRVTAIRDTGRAEVVATLSNGGTFAVAYDPDGPCSGSNFREFDFWLGEWTLQPTTPTGEQTIARHPSGCFITENFRQGPYRGSSVNNYDPATQRWYQTYVDSEGARIVLVGQFLQGAMVLANRADPNGQRWQWRMTDSSTVRHFQERSTNGGQTWTQVNDLRYVRR